jgi:hypothetical protein
MGDVEWDDEGDDATAGASTTATVVSDAAATATKLAEAEAAANDAELESDDDEDEQEEEELYGSVSIIQEDANQADGAAAGGSTMAADQSYEVQYHGHAGVIEPDGIDTISAVATKLASEAVGGFTPGPEPLVFSFVKGEFILRKPGSGGAVIFKLLVQEITFSHMFDAVGTRRGARFSAEIYTR